MNHCINICYITDNNYVQHTIVSIASLFANRFHNTQYRVFVICDMVDDEHKRMMKCLENPKNARIELIDSDNAYRKKSYELGKYISAATYIRLNLPSILGEIDKLLYLDGDTII